MKGAALTPEQGRRVLGDFLDHEAFCRQALRIRDKRGVPVPLHLTPAQRKLAQAIDKVERRGVPVRIRVLKARQVHMSVGAASQVFRRVAFLPGQKAKVYAHLDEATRNLFDYYLQFDETYAPLHGLAKLKRKRMQVGQSIAYEGGGLIEFGSAETGRGGRANSFKYLHLSETAFWRAGGSELRTGLLNSVPDLPDTLVIDESTANGMGGPFYDGWRAAEDPNGHSGWLGVFFAWFEHPEYQAAIADPHAFEKSLTDEEHALRQRHGVMPEQLAWRRWAIVTKCEGDRRRFQQEFPSDAQEAFLTSGRPRFCMVSLGRMPTVADPLAGELEEITVGTRATVQFVPREDGTGSLRVWKRPAAGRQYVIGADPAQGIDVNEGRGTADPDYSVAQVLDRETGEQVAVLRARLEPAAFAETLWALMRFYQHAYCVPEANNHGVAVIGELLRLQVPLHLLYRRRREADDRRPPLLQELGFLTLTNTKPQLVSQLDRAVREMSVVVRDPQTLGELRTFVYHANGTASAQRGAHDDLVIALGLAVQGLLTAPRETARVAPTSATPHTPVSYRRWTRGPGREEGEW